MDPERQAMYEGIIEQVGFPRVDKIEGLLPNDNVLYAIRTDLNDAENHYLQLHPRLLQLAEEKGFLVPEKSRIIDTSSSNSGISLAMAAKLAGFPLKMIIPTELEDKVRRYTVKAIREQDAEVVYPEPYIHETSTYVAACAQQLAKEIQRARHEGRENDFVLNHSRCYETLIGLEEMTAIILDRLGVPIDFFIPGVGNGATILGPGKVLKERFGEGTEVVAWEPVSSGLAFDLKEEGTTKVYDKDYKGAYTRRFGVPRGTFRHDIYGTGVPDVKFPFLHIALFGGDTFGIAFNETGDRTDKRTYPQVVDEVALVANEFMIGDARAEGIPEDKFMEFPIVDYTHRDLLRKGFAIGRSSAASVAVAEQKAEEVSGKNFLVFFYDSAAKYEL